MTMNPDLQSSIPMIMQLLDQIHSGQQQLLQLWQIKKAKLDQCLQLRMFEQDCEKVNSYPPTEGFVKGKELCLFCDKAGWLLKYSLHYVWLAVLL